MMDSATVDALAKVLWDYNNLEQPITKADCILVFGSHDVRVARRAAELWLQDYASLIIFSGGLGRLTKGVWSRTEAQTFIEEAIKMGVPEDKILLEDKSTNTGENIEFTKVLLKQKHLTPRTAIVVQKPYMLRRAYASLRKRWPELEVMMTAPAITYEQYPDNLTSRERLINMLVGDTQRIKVYADMGFLVPQEMPSDVWDAYTQLVKMGYTKYLVKEGGV